MKRRVLALLWFGLLPVSPALAEPWLAVREGLKCAACHTNPSGGGMRTEFGNTWARAGLPVRQLETDAAWTGRLTEQVAIGGNLRSNAIYVRDPDRDDTQAFNLEEMRLYLDVEPVPDRLGLYLDQRLAPGGGQVREAYSRYRSAGGSWTFKTGRMYLPYGLRLEDDTALVRQASGINFDNPDEGVELGWESSRWSSQAAITDGVPGQTGKRFSLRAEHVRQSWRAGASYSLTQTDSGDRWMQNAFAGWRTGPVAWLAELNHIRDASLPPPSDRQWVGLAEANWTAVRGHNLKLTGEWLDAGSDQRSRYSAVWEYFPIPFLQLRVGTRVSDVGTGIGQDSPTRFFGQIHGFF